MALRKPANRWYTMSPPVKPSRFLVPSLFLLPILGALGYFFLPWRDVTNPLPYPVSQGVPEARYERLGMGVNLTHWFAQKEKYDFEVMRRYHTTAELDAFVEMGVRHVRLPFVMEAFDGSTSNLKLNEKKFGLFLNLIEQINKRGMMVMVFFHPPEPYKKTLQDDPKAVEDILKMWDLMSKRLSRFSPDQVTFEPLSEPNFTSAKQWESVQYSLIQTIRKNCPKHTIIAQGGGYSTIDDLIQLRPYQDTNIVYAFHFYEPFLFTHQGASWVDPNMTGLGIVRYPSTPENLKSISSRVRTSGQSTYYERHAKEHPWNQYTLRNKLSLLEPWRKKYGAKVICNEFGLNRMEIVAEDRAAWLRDMTAAFKSQGINWSFYEWLGGMGIIYDRVTKKEGFESIDRPCLEALGFKMPTYQPMGPSVKDFTGAVAK
jgi:endoglucanase